MRMNNLAVRKSQVADLGLFSTRYFLRKSRKLLVISVSSGLQIIETMPIDREITRTRVEVRWLDSRDVIRVADTRHVLGNVGPGGAEIATHLNIAVVSPDPDKSRNLRRLGYSHNVTVTRVTIMLRRHRILAGHAHDWKRVAIDLLGEIDRCGPGVAAIHRAEKPVTANPDEARVVRREMNRRIPVETKDFIRGRRRHDVRL